MESKEILPIKNKEEFRSWLKENGTKAKECYLLLKRAKPEQNNIFYYLDAVEVALCYGWIDSRVVYKEGMTIQRFTPRSKNSPWSELNKERVRRLENLGLMTEEGKKVLPKMGERSFVLPKEIIDALKQARCYSKFKSFPIVYQRIRAYNVMFYYDRDKKTYDAALKNLIVNTKKGKMYGNWDDYGRLSKQKE